MDITFPPRTSQDEVRLHMVDAKGSTVLKYDIIYLYCNIVYIYIYVIYVYVYREREREMAV